MGIEINFDPIWNVFSSFDVSNPIILSFELFMRGGWLVLLCIFTWAIYEEIWLDLKQDKYKDNLKWVVLAIDIPRDNEQTPKAVEAIFAALNVAEGGGNLIEKWYDGEVRNWFSFEIVSLEGYLQFIIRTQKKFRDLVESAIYSQYPSAEITEVKDYAREFCSEWDEEHNKPKKIGIKFPNKEWKLWGTELVLAKEAPYPLKSYVEFEHQLSQSFLDPLSTLLEILSRFDKGEYLFIQLVLTPQKKGSWGEVKKKVLKEFMGEKYEKPKTGFDSFIDRPVGWSQKVSEQLIIAAGMEAPESKKDEKKPDVGARNLRPGQRDVLERIERKLGHIFFRTKFRVVYLAKKEVFNKEKGEKAVLGALEQYNTPDANYLKKGKETVVSADYFFEERRKNERRNTIFRHLLKRDNVNGDSNENMLFDTEELASLWHFPAMTVKAPAVEKIASKKVVPPTRLPLGDRGFEKVVTDNRDAIIAAKKAELRAAMGLSGVEQQSAIIMPTVQNTVAAPVLQNVESIITHAEEIKAEKVIAESRKVFNSNAGIKLPTVSVAVDEVKTVEIKKPRGGPPSNLPIA